MDKQPGRPNHQTYMDDVTVGGTEIDSTWRDTLEAIRRIVAVGFPINSEKLQLLELVLAILGVLLRGDQFQLGHKALRKLFGSSLPRSLRDLQALLGRLNFASQFIPDYRRRVKPLIALLGRKGGEVWTEEHTARLNELAGLVAKRIKLGLVDMSQPATLHVNGSETDCSGVLTQGRGLSYTVVAMVGREFTITEQGYPDLERLLTSVYWCLKRLAKYTLYLPKVTVAVPSASMLAAVKSKDLHAKLQAQVMEIASFGVTFVDGMGAWDVQSSIADIKQTALDGTDTPSQVWQHETITIKKPSSEPEPTTMKVADALRAYFDGGCREKLGTGGCLLFEPSGKLIEAHAIYYGDGAPTNNVAECKAMVDCTEAVSKCNWQPHYSGALINGDSKLTISFMQRKARPGKRDLVLAV